MFLLPHLSALLSVSPFPQVSLHRHLSVFLISLSLSVFPCVWPVSISVSPCPPHFPLFPRTSLFPLRMSLWPHISSPVHPTNLSAHISLCSVTSPSYLGLPIPHHFSPSSLTPLSFPPLFPLCSPSLSLLCLGLRSSLDLRNPIICGGPEIAVVIAQSPAPPTLDAKPELLHTKTPSA